MKKTLLSSLCVALMSFVSLTVSAQDGVLPDTLFTAPSTNYALSDTTVIGKFIEYEDSVVLDNFDGNGAHIKATWDSKGWNAINGYSNTYVYFKDANYYCGYFYSSCIGGKWDHQNGGEFWMGAYCYKADRTYDWKYLDFKLMTKAQKDAYNAQVKAAKAAAALKARIAAMPALDAINGTQVYTFDKCASYAEEGWLALKDETASPSTMDKKSTIDPETDETIGQTVYTGVDVKKGNNAKTAIVKVTGVYEVHFYFATDKNNERAATVTLYDTNESQCTGKIAKNTGASLTFDTLDPDKEYAFFIEGNDMVNEGAGADVDFYAIKTVGIDISDLNEEYEGLIEDNMNIYVKEALEATHTAANEETSTENVRAYKEMLAKAAASVEAFANTEEAYDEYSTKALDLDIDAYCSFFNATKDILDELMNGVLEEDKSAAIQQAYDDAVAQATAIASVKASEVETVTTKKYLINHKVVIVKQEAEDATISYNASAIAQAAKDAKKSARAVKCAAKKPTRATKCAKK